MKSVISAAIIVAAAMLVSCTQQPQAARQQRSSTEVQPRIIQGTVTELSRGHGNAYTSIRPDRYESLGLEAGKQIRVAFADTELTMVIGRDYTDVPSGVPVAVLHREGLTFAIRDGNFSSMYGITAGAPFTITVMDQR